MTDLLRDQLQAALGSTYTIERELGGGGMSRVFLATDTRLERQVVIKVLPHELAASISAERFAREIKVAAQLQEPHIVPVLSDGVTAESLPFYIMPFIRGASLRERMNEGPVPASTAVSILRDVARALAYSHSRGVVHRDIKPENVLLHEGTAVVTDFGIAKAVDASRTRPTSAGATLTQLGTSLGTPAHMAPEQAAGDPATDHRADLYAWGVMAYELIAGRHPFAGKTSPQQLMAAHFSESPTPLATTGARVSRAVTDVIMRCLAKDPAQRPASAAELVAVLDESGSVLSASPASRLLRSMGMLAAATAVLLAAGLAWRARGGVSEADASAPVMLAVLPFDNSGSAEQADFTDGLTDAITAKLGALPGLAVIDRRSASRYRQSTKPVKQIGAELGVRYLLEGVVRWAKDASGAWRAQVTPTLVDARAGTTKWTGEPVLTTPADPFTAQSVVAGKVSEALQIALRPSDRAGLARRLTGSPEAFAAYERGRSVMENFGRDGFNARELKRAVVEFERAVSLDTSFAEAWAGVASSTSFVANYAPEDSMARQQMRIALARASAHASQQPTVPLLVAFERWLFDHDTTGMDAAIWRAVAAAPNDAAVLSLAGDALTHRQQPESAFVFLRRAATLDPRSRITLVEAGFQMAAMRRWSDARHYGDALIALDSTDEVGWAIRLNVDQYRGDTLSLQRDIRSALGAIAHPSAFVLGFMPKAGDSLAMRFLALSPRELGTVRPVDIVMSYFSIKADASLRLRDVPRARIYYDSSRALAARVHLNGVLQVTVLAERALAQAALGDRAGARAALEAAMLAARPFAARKDMADVLPTTTMAAAYGWIGDPATAVQWLEAALADPFGNYTAAAFAADPRLFPLHGTPAFRGFLVKHPP